MKTKIILLFALCLFSCKATKTTMAEDIVAIRSVLEKQQKAWSNHDLEGFMDGYWQSDSLSFFSGGKMTKGWQTTFANYKRGYPTKADSGALTFEIADISKISEDAYWVMGSYFLKRDAGDADGTFMIVFKRINGEWKIIGDSSC